MKKRKEFNEMVNKTETGLIEIWHNVESHNKENVGNIITDLIKNHLIQEHNARCHQCDWRFRKHGYIGGNGQHYDCNCDCVFMPEYWCIYCSTPQKTLRQENHKCYLKHSKKYR